ncbi:hypothetical protein BaRGS_00002609 [Batillaria attramentaria]|uniref:Uncharacterized protein n=1 Tax=Batillaria attramentaria TaxID=370345 RepID=A0ABD0M3V5_9CAEN
MSIISRQEESSKGGIENRREGGGGGPSVKMRIGTRGELVDEMHNDVCRQSLHSITMTGKAWPGHETGALLKKRSPVECPSLACCCCIGPHSTAITIEELCNTV